MPCVVSTHTLHALVHFESSKVIIIISINRLPSSTTTGGFQRPFQNRKTKGQEYHFGLQHPFIPLFSPNTEETISRHLLWLTCNIYEKDPPDTGHIKKASPKLSHMVSVLLLTFSYWSHWCVATCTCTGRPARENVRSGDDKAQKSLSVRVFWNVFLDRGFCSQGLVAAAGRLVFTLDQQSRGKRVTVLNFHYHKHTCPSVRCHFNPPLSFSPQTQFLQGFTGAIKYSSLFVTDFQCQTFFPFTCCITPFFFFCCLGCWF